MLALSDQLQQWLTEHREEPSLDPSLSIDMQKIWQNLKGTFSSKPKYLDPERRVCFEQVGNVSAKYGRFQVFCRYDDIDVNSRLYTTANTLIIAILHVLSCTGAVFQFFSINVK